MYTFLKGKFPFYLLDFPCVSTLTFTDSVVLTYDITHWHSKLIACWDWSKTSTFVPKSLTFKASSTSFQNHGEEYQLALSCLAYLRQSQLEALRIPTVLSRTRIEWKKILCTQNRSKETANFTTSTGDTKDFWGTSMTPARKTNPTESWLWLNWLASHLFTNRSLNQKHPSSTSYMEQRQHQQTQRPGLRCVDSRREDPPPYPTRSKV